MCLDFQRSRRIGLNIKNISIGVESLKCFLLHFPFCKVSIFSFFSLSRVATTMKFKPGGICPGKGCWITSVAWNREDGGYDI